MSIVRVLRSPLVRNVLLLITFALIAWALRGQWADVQNSARTLHLRWGWIAAASAIMLLTYAMLVQSWRLLLAGWGGHLPYWKAVQIWTVANLGRYLPGKVWSISALGLLSAREGVSGVAAAGASVLGTLLNIGAGFGIAVIFGGNLLDAISPGAQRLSTIAAGLFVLGVAALPVLLPAVLDRFARWRGMPLADQHLTNRDVWMAAVINSISWIGYGVAFSCFARGVLPIFPAPTLSIAVYAASYLVGFLILFAPGGIGFREFALGALLVSAGVMGQGDATVLGATSRIWLTVLEVLPGVIGLLFMSPKQRAELSRNEAIPDRGS